MLYDDPGVVLDVRGRRYLVDEAGEESNAAGTLEHA